jgi:hypothetical protein
MMAGMPGRQYALQPFRLLCALSLAATLGACGGGTAYFMFDQKSPEGKPEHFVFALDDSAKIAEAREILAGDLPKHVAGTIIKQRAPYNPNWSFHLEPASISFFEMAAEVSDANVTYVEAHLDEVGGSTLPNSHWCPWSSRLSKEVTDQIDPETRKPTKPLE